VCDEPENVRKLVASGRKDGGELRDVHVSVGFVGGNAVDDSVIPVEGFFGDVPDCGRYRGGEEEGLASFWQFADDGVEVCGETHFKEGVGLVEDELIAVERAECRLSTTE
jgi:hypothetical protein